MLSRNLFPSENFSSFFPSSRVSSFTPFCPGCKLCARVTNHSSGGYKNQAGWVQMDHGLYFGSSSPAAPFRPCFLLFFFPERLSPPLCRLSLIDPTGLYGPTRCDKHFIMGPVDWPLQDRPVTKSWTERALDQPLHDRRGTIGCSKMHLVRYGWAPCHIPAAAATPMRHANSSRQTHTPNPNCSLL